MKNHTKKMSLQLDLIRDFLLLLRYKWTIEHCVWKRNLLLRKEW